MISNPAPGLDLRSQPAGAAALPPIEGIEPATLMQLLRGDVARCRRLLQAFAEHHADDVDRLRSARGDGLTRLLHGLKGSAAAVGAEDVAGIACELEQRLRRGDAGSDLQPELSHLADRLQQLVAQIRHRLPQSTAAPGPEVASSPLSLQPKPETRMLEFDIANLSCGHCVRAVTEALHELDPGARVEVDLPGRHVKVDTAATRDHVVAALVEAGYAPSAPAGA